MTVQDLSRFHSTYFHPGNAVFIVVGDVDAELIRPKLESLFGTWEAGEVPPLRSPKAGQVERRQIYLVDKPGAAQSVIRIGRIGVPRQTEDYDAIVVMTTILGGSFASRLNQNLREEHGHTYGAGSFFDFRPLPGPFHASADDRSFDIGDQAPPREFSPRACVAPPLRAESSISELRGKSRSGPVEL